MAPNVALLLAALQLHWYFKHSCNVTKPFPFLEKAFQIFFSPLLHFLHMVFLLLSTCFFFFFINSVGINLNVIPLEKIYKFTVQFIVGPICGSSTESMHFSFCFVIIIKTVFSVFKNISKVKFIKNMSQFSYEFTVPNKF